MNISTGQILAGTTLVDAKHLSLEAMNAATTTNADKIVQLKTETFPTHLKKTSQGIYPWISSAHLFASSKRDLCPPPPPEDAFHLHVLRSLCQISLNKQASLINPVLLSLEEYGRSMDGAQVNSCQEKQVIKTFCCELDVLQMQEETEVPQ
ncbi:hypothetical protein SK128_005002 [Halocaridina rubra]|uniref:Uncharacterized protein n=1 Tax=Halocaridina rubra TaxID=373956 RepID=A0AAN9FTL4_HALRR